MKPFKAINPPDRIYLQIGDIEQDCDFNECYQNGDVSWCPDRIYDTDIEYRLVKRRRKPSKPAGEQSK